MSDLLIDMVVHIKRPVSEDFEAWTNSDAFASWFAPMAKQRPDVEMDFVVGGRYSIVMPLPDGTKHTTSGAYQKIVQDQTIIMTWRCDAFDDPESQVEVQFVASEDGTDIHLKHKTFESTDTCKAHRGGWEACLGGLDNYLKTTSEG